MLNQQSQSKFRHNYCACELLQLFYQMRKLVESVFSWSESWLDQTFSNGLVVVNRRVTRMYPSCCGTVNVLLKMTPSVVIVIRCNYCLIFSPLSPYVSPMH